MLFRTLALPPSIPGRMGLISMPGRLESFAAFLDAAHRQQLTRVVCLNPLEEVAQLSPAYHRAITTASLPFTWQHLPMRDFGLGLDPVAFREGVEAIARDVTQGGVVLLHCAAGVGRTGTVAACVLKRLGQDSAGALAAVRAAGSNPQSALQSGWIDRF